MLFSLFLIIAVAMRPFLSMKMHLNRKYVPIRNDLLLNDVNNIRVMQYNILADGLSGLRSDHGGFSRIKKQFLEWDYRKSLFFSEIVECNPDVITFQECDHFVDFFEPELKKLGYQGVFAPKPASACLEVSSRSDGCAVFVKTSKIKIVSTEVCRNIITIAFKAITLLTLCCGCYVVIAAAAAVVVGTDDTIGIELRSTPAFDMG